MSKEKTNNENILLRGLSHIFIRTIEVNYEDKLAITKE